MPFGAAINRRRCAIGADVRCVLRRLPPVAMQSAAESGALGRANTRGHHRCAPPVGSIVRIPRTGTLRTLRTVETRALERTSDIALSAASARNGASIAPWRAEIRPSRTAQSGHRDNRASVVPPPLDAPLRDGRVRRRRGWPTVVAAEPAAGEVAGVGRVGPRRGGRIHRCVRRARRAFRFRRFDHPPARRPATLCRAH